MYNLILLIENINENNHRWQNNGLLNILNIFFKFLD